MDVLVFAAVGSLLRVSGLEGAFPLVPVWPPLRMCGLELLAEVEVFPALRADGFALCPPAGAWLLIFGTDPVLERGVLEWPVDCPTCGRPERPPPL